MDEFEDKALEDVDTLIKEQWRDAKLSQEVKNRMLRQLQSRLEQDGRIVDFRQIFVAASLLIAFFVGSVSFFKEETLLPIGEESFLAQSFEGVDLSDSEEFYFESDYDYFLDAENSSL